MLEPVRHQSHHHLMLVEGVLDHSSLKPEGKAKKAVIKRARAADKFYIYLYQYTTIYNARSHPPSVFFPFLLNYNFSHVYLFLIKTFLHQ